MTITGSGITLGIPSEDKNDCDTPLEDASSLVKRIVDMHCSVRQLHHVPRAFHAGALTSVGTVP